jgi:hypothetical protein
MLLDQNGGRLADGSDSTRRVRLDGSGQKWVFTISRSHLLGDNTQTQLGATTALQTPGAAT